MCDFLFQLRDFVLVLEFNDFDFFFVELLDLAGLGKGYMTCMKDWWDLSLRLKISASRSSLRIRQFSQSLDKFSELRVLSRSQTMNLL